MLLEHFNRVWERERQKIESRLESLLENEIKSLRASISNEAAQDPAYGLELKKMLANLVLRQALVAYESEDILKRRMELRFSYIAIALSSVALVVSAISLSLK